MDTEILMAMIESGKSKRVRRKLLQDQLTLAEALIRQVSKARINTPEKWRTKHQRTSPLNNKWIKLQRTEQEKNRVSIAGNSGRTKGDQENAQLLASRVGDAEKRTISRIIVKANKKLKPVAQPPRRQPFSVREKMEKRNTTPSGPRYHRKS